MNRKDSLPIASTMAAREANFLMLKYSPPVLNAMVLSIVELTVSSEENAYTGTCSILRGSSFVLVLWNPSEKSK